ncbi:MAG: glycosyltransferase family 39 protein [Thermoanaerobaculia bacterium]
MELGQVSHRTLVLLLLGAFAILCLHGLVWDSPTADEFTHLPVGYFYLKTGDFDLAARTPPLIKELAALPLLPLSPQIRTAKPARESAWYPWILGTDFMQRNRPVYDRLFLLGRLPIVALALLMGVVVHRWSRELYGPAAGLVALTFFAFNPTLIGHSHVVTADVGVAALGVLALYLFYRWSQEPTAVRMLVAGLALGLAQLAKTTSVLLYPVLALLVAVALLRGERPVGRRVGGLAAIVLVSLLVLNAGYLFQGTGKPLGSFDFQSHFMRGIAGHLPAGLPMPLPAPYLEGFDGVRLDAESGEFPNYLFGRWSRQGTPVYYLVCLLFKTPLPLLLACALAPFVRLGTKARGEIYLGLPLAVLLVSYSVLTGNVNYGIRHILSAFPLLFIYASRLTPFFLERGLAIRRTALAVLAVYPLSALIATPNTLDYFNVLARGRGDRILLDSNIDWGQGLKRVRKYMDREGLDHIALAYFGHVDPALYGIDFHLPQPGEPGPIAVSANFLHGYGYMTFAGGRMVPVPPDEFRWLEKYPEIEYLGGGMFVVRAGIIPSPVHSRRALP